MNSLRLNALIGFIGHNLYQYLPFILPHDKSYHGFSHLTENKNGLFLDVGANDGISAMGFRNINRQYKILSLEPNQSLETRLKRLKTRLKPFEYKMVGAGRKSGYKTLYIPVYKRLPIYTAASCDMNYLKKIMAYQFPNMKKGDIFYRKQMVKIMRLDDLKLQPDIIKLDTEGYDYEALIGLSKTIRTFRPYIMLEFFPEDYYSGVNFLKKRRYDFFTYNHQDHHFSPINFKKETEKFYKTRLISNFFCIPKEKMGKFRPI